MLWERQALSAGSVDRQWALRKSPSPELCSKLTCSQYTSPYGERLLWRGLHGPAHQHTTRSKIHCAHTCPGSHTHPHDLTHRHYMNVCLKVTHTELLHSPTNTVLVLCSRPIQEMWMEWHRKSKVSSEQNEVLTSNVQKHWCSKWWWKDATSSKWIQNNV